MGLMNFLEPFATGYLEASVDRMQALAEAKAKKQELEDKYRLEETLQINLQNNRFENEADLLTAEKENKKQTVTDILNAEGMSPELQIMLAPYTTDLQTYNSFLEQNGYKGYGWFKEPVPFVERDSAGINIYEGMTFENFILSENKKALDTKEKDTQNNLTSSGGVLDGQPNTAKTLISSSMAEEAIGTATTVQSPFPSSFDEQTTEQLNLAQVEKTGELPQEDIDRGFEGVTIPFSKFNIKRIANISNAERESRARNINRELAIAGGFEGKIIITDQGLDTSKLLGFDLAKWNTLQNLAIDIVRTTEEDQGIYLDSKEVVQQAIAKQAEIERTYVEHSNGVLNPIHDLAVKAGVVSAEDAILYTIYEDITNMNPTEIKYYMQYANNIGGKEGARIIKLINSPEFQKADGFDDIATRIDDAVIGSINLDFEDIYDDDGELIQKGKDFDKDDSIFTEGSAGEKIEEDLFGETTADPDKKKIITPKVEDGITTYDLSSINVGDDKVELPTITGTQRRDAIKTSDSITVKGENNEDIVYTLGSTVKIGNFIFKISDKAIQDGMSNTLEFENLGTEKNVPNNPNVVKLNQIKLKIKELNRLEKNLEKESTLPFGKKESREEKLNEINTLKQEIETAIKDLQGE